MTDNAASNYGSNGTQSQGLLIELDLKTNSSRLVQVFQTPGGKSDLLAQSQGSFLYLSPNDSGNAFMGYGALNYFAEYDEETGDALQLVSFQDDGEAVQNYRAFKQTWNGDPKGFIQKESDSKFNSSLTKFNPIQVRPQPDSVEKDGKLFFSWNGLVGTKKWSIEFGKKAGTGKHAAYKVIEKKMVESKGFETEVDIGSKVEGVKLIALDGHGKELGAGDWKAL